MLSFTRLQKIDAKDTRPTYLRVTAKENRLELEFLESDFYDRSPVMKVGTKLLNKRKNMRTRQFFCTPILAQLF